MALLDAHCLEHLPLGWAGGGEDLGPPVLGDPDRRHPHSTGAGVDQDPLARFQLGQVVEAVEGGGKDDRDRRRLLGGEALGDPGEEVALGGGEGAEGVGDQAHHGVSGREVGDLGADLEHNPCSLATDRGLSRVDAEGDQDVAEVEPRGLHLDPHPRRAQGLLGAGDEREALQGAALCGVEAPGDRRRDQRVLCVGCRHHPGRQRHPLAQSQLGLLRPQG